MYDEYRFSVDGRVPVLKVHREPRPGPAVLVLHGLGASAEVQRKELYALAGRGLTAVAIDAPHHGARRDGDGWLDELDRMEPPESHVRFLRLLQEAIPEVSRVLDHLTWEGHGPFGVVGISMGAYLALAIAAADPRVRATVSILGSPDWSPRQGPITDEMGALMRSAPVHRPEACARHPLLMFNAGRDVNVPPRGAREFARRIAAHHRALALHVTYVEYPKSDHFMRGQDWNDLWGWTLAFFGAQLG